MLKCSMQISNPRLLPGRSGSSISMKEFFEILENSDTSINEKNTKRMMCLFWSSIVNGIVNTGSHQAWSDQRSFLYYVSYTPLKIKKTPSATQINNPIQKRGKDMSRRFAKEDRWMTNKQVKWYSSLLIIRERQVKAQWFTISHLQGWL